MDPKSHSFYFGAIKSRISFYPIGSDESYGSKGGGNDEHGDSPSPGGGSLAVNIGVGQNIVILLLFSTSKIHFIQKMTVLVAFAFLPILSRQV